ncbi:MAG TPA: DUF6152 family protein [Geobacterales bacterium]|nr:DUF6152 family protein [Geobacterales bacterium]
MSTRAQVSSVAMNLLGLSFVGAAYAHHSFAAYDMTRSLTVQATVKEFRWSAPHSSLVLMVTLPNGQARELNLVTGPPDIFARQGIAPKSLRSGDKLEATYHPNINGSAGGSLAGFTLPDGRTFKDQESFGAAPPSSPSPSPSSSPR